MQDTDRREEQVHTVWISHPNGAKERKTFWKIAEAFEYCSELVRKGYQQDECGEGFSRWSIAA